MRFNRQLTDYEEYLYDLYSVLDRFADSVAIKSLSQLESPSFLDFGARIRYGPDGHEYGWGVSSRIERHCLTSICYNPFLKSEFTAFNCYYRKKLPNAVDFIRYKHVLHHLDLKQISKMTSKLLNPNGFVLAFDYNLKGRSKDEFLKLFSMQVERSELKEFEEKHADSVGLQLCYDVHTRFGPEDYEVEFERSGLKRILLEKNEKFFVYLGQRTN